MCSLFAIWSGMIFAYILHASSATQEYKDRLDRLLVGCWLRRGAPPMRGRRPLAAARRATPRLGQRAQRQARAHTARHGAAALRGALGASPQQRFRRAAPPPVPQLMLNRYRVPRELRTQIIDFMM